MIPFHQKDYKKSTGTELDVRRSSELDVRPRSDISPTQDRMPPVTVNPRRGNRDPFAPGDYQEEHRGFHIGLKVRLMILALGLLVAISGVFFFRNAAGWLSDSGSSVMSSGKYDVFYDYVGDIMQYYSWCDYNNLTYDTYSMSTEKESEDYLGYVNATVKDIGDKHNTDIYYSLQTLEEFGSRTEHLKSDRYEVETAYKKYIDDELTGLMLRYPDIGLRYVKTYEEWSREQNKVIMYDNQKNMQDYADYFTNKITDANTHYNEKLVKYGVPIGLPYSTWKELTYAEGETFVLLTEYLKYTEGFLYGDLDFVPNSDTEFKLWS